MLHSALDTKLTIFQNNGITISVEESDLLVLHVLRFARCRRLPLQFKYPLDFTRDVIKDYCFIFVLLI